MAAEDKGDSQRIRDLVYLEGPSLTEDDIQEVKSIRDRATLRLSSIDSRIQELARLTKQLNLEKISTLGLRDKCDTLLHPIRSVPDDVLHEIFMHYIHHPAHGPSGFPVVPKTSVVTEMMRRPWIVSQVSRRWRNAALGLSALWSYFFLDLNAEDCPDLGLLHLERAGSCSLHVILKAASGRTNTATPALLTALLSASSTWKSLRLYLEPSWLNPILPTIQGRLERLEELVVVVPRGPHSDRLSSTFWPAPSLRTIQWYSLPVLDTRVSWPSLRCCDLVYDSSDRLEANTFLSLLQRQPHLPKLSIFVLSKSQTVREDPLPSYPTVSSSCHLTCLQLMMAEGNGILGLLHQLCLPALKELQLVFRASYLEETHVSPVSEFLARSECTLQRLGWLGALRNQDHFLQFLTSIPSLTSLVFYDFPDGIIRGLCWTDDRDTGVESRILPSLRLLGVQLPRESLSSHQLLLDTVESRLESLQHLKLIQKARFSDDVLERVAKCQTNGLNVINGVLCDGEALSLWAMDEMMNIS